MEHQARAILPGLGGYRYELRPIRFLGTSRRPTGWQVKLYAITVAGRDGEVPDAAIQAARRVSEAALPLLPGADASHGAAVLTMHMGLQGFWVLVDWWAHGDVLMHRHFRAEPDQPEALRDVSGEGYGPCVWELAVQAHERGAWLRHVLTNPAGPDLDGYLEDGLSAVV